MVPIDRLPGREQATLNELCRQIVEALRPPSPSPDNVLRWPLERQPDYSSHMSSSRAK
jgi:hypothetical protein